MAQPNVYADNSYLDIQAEVGITKHMGGFEATNELLTLCHIAEAREVLYVGCGIGIGPAYIARTHGCRVVGVDISEKMLRWARQRAKEERVEDKVIFQIADVLQLPFDADRFDAVLVESVLAFVEDKSQAIRECVRVTKPGGYVGVNESYWNQEPSAEMITRARVIAGTSIPTLATWQTVWDASGLQNRVVRPKPLDARAEIKSRIKWIGWRWMLKAWGRVLKLYFTNPGARHSIKEQLKTPMELFRLMGYGIFVGQKMVHT